MNDIIFPVAYAFLFGVAAGVTAVIYATHGRGKAKEPEKKRTPEEVLIAQAIFYWEVKVIGSGHSFRRSCEEINNSVMKGELISDEKITEYNRAVSTYWYARGNHEEAIQRQKQISYQKKHGTYPQSTDQ